MTLSLAACKRRLAFLWLVCGGFFYIVLILQSINYDYSDEQLKILWAWALPTVLPTFSLIISSFIADVAQSAPDKQVDSFLYRMTMGISITYILVAFLPMLSDPTRHGTQLLHMLQESNLWLAPLQGAVVSLASVFFSKGRK